MASPPILRLGSTGGYVWWLQTNLQALALNYNNFAIDGTFDAKTEAVVRNFQDKYFVSTGIVDAVTWKLLNENVQAVQRLLVSNGYNAGSADGWFGPRTKAALLQFQRNAGLSESGIVDPRTRQRLFDPRHTDNFESRPTSTSLSALNPYVAALATKFLTLTKEQGMDVRIIAAFRSWADEDRFYSQGRTTPGPVITNARGGESYHNWGLAFDAAPFVNGKESTDVQQFKKMGKIGQSVGLTWGGSFRSIVDYPHFEYTFGLDPWDLLNGVRPSK